MTKIAVIGGGASGMVCAIEAARKGYSVIVLEKQDRVGKKLLATGNGRCNLANTDFSIEHYHGSVRGIAGKIFEEVPPTRIREFWHQLGIEYTEGDRGKLFPRSLQAASVLNALRREMERLGVKEAVGIRAEKVTKTKDGYEIRLSVKKPAPEKDKRIKPGYTTKVLRAEKVMICMGGKASPKFGADGDSYHLAKELGLATNPLSPAICRIKIDSPYNKRLSGVKNTAPIRLWAGKNLIQTAFGEVLFTDEGVSGPPVLDLSRAAGEITGAGAAPAKLTMDLAPEMKMGELFSYWMERFERMKDCMLEEAMEGWLPKKLIPVVLLVSDLDPKMSAGKAGKSEVRRLCENLKNYPMKVSGISGFEEAQVTVGGLNEKELTEGLESKRYPGMYWCGEAVDLDGDCGGYNLMWAVASAIAACEDVGPAT